MKIAIAGGTGLVGSLVADAVCAAGHAPVILARATGVELTRALSPADVGGATRLIDVTNVVTSRRRRSIRFFETVTGNLLAVASQAGVEHHVALSVINCDRVDFGYYHGKRRQEELALTGPVPASVLRASQFHEFADQLIRRGRGVLLVPRMLCRPVAAAEVAAALVRIALGDPIGRAPEISGPDEHRLVDMVRRVLAVRGDRRLVVPVKLPGKPGRQLAEGGLLPDAPGEQGEQSFDAYLADYQAGAARGAW